MTDSTDNARGPERITPLTQEKLDNLWEDFHQNLAAADQADIAATQMDDLLKRLQSQRLVNVHRPEKGYEPMNPDGKEAADEITALRARLEAVEKERDHWKLNCQSNAAAMNNVEESFGQIFPVGVRDGAERGPDPVEWAADVISAMHIVRERAEAALTTALEGAATVVEGEGHNPNLRRIADRIRALANEAKA